MATGRLRSGVHPTTGGGVALAVAEDIMVAVVVGTAVEVVVVVAAVVEVGGASSSGSSCSPHCARVHARPSTQYETYPRTMSAVVQFAIVTQRNQGRRQLLLNEHPMPLVGQAISASEQCWSASGRQAKGSGGGGGGSPHAPDLQPNSWQIVARAATSLASRHASATQQR
jgi:hypothetical protein